MKQARAEADASEVLTKTPFVHGMVRTPAAVQIDVQQAAKESRHG